MTVHLKSDLPELSARYADIQIQQDPGERGLKSWAVQDQILEVVQSLFQGRHIYLATGFYILEAGQIETDGPPGALVLADVLVKAGKKVTLIYDNHSDEIMRAGLRSADKRICTRVLDTKEIIDPEQFLEDDVSHFVALERPGKAFDGKYYNFSGMDISEYHCSLDEVYSYCRSNSITTIGIGDGGNELGMGILTDKVKDYHNLDRPFSSVFEADYCVCAGVSNWGGYAMASLLSIMDGRNHMISPDSLRTLLKDIVAAGAVDGVTAEQTDTVDGLEPRWEDSIYSRMYRLSELITKKNKDWIPETYYIGDSCLCWSLGDDMDEAKVRTVLSLYSEIKSSPLNEKIRDLVPSYKSLALHFAEDDPGIDNLTEAVHARILEELISLHCADEIPPLKGKTVTLPVIYNGEDLERVALNSNLSADDVVRIHTQGRYTVAMVGFKPHFPYLLGLDTRLETPRLDSPRTKIPAGAVAIGGAQTGIYPEDSPGGWNLIGMTDPGLLEQIEPGDTIVMKEVETL
jgi:KipI family sensor histidine kinase inhibitor